MILSSPRQPPEPVVAWVARAVLQRDGPQMTMLRNVQTTAGSQTISESKRWVLQLLQHSHVWSVRVSSKFFNLSTKLSNICFLTFKSGYVPKICRNAEKSTRQLVKERHLRFYLGKAWSCTLSREVCNPSIQTSVTFPNFVELYFHCCEWYESRQNHFSQCKMRFYPLR